MANTQKYLNHLLQNTGITPACSEEERAAADVVAGIFSNHGFTPEVQEFSASGSAKVVQAALGIIAFLGAVLMGVGGAAGIVGFLLALAAAVIFVLERSGRPVLSQLGGGGLSQNVIAYHKASGPLASPRNRPVVVVAHYDSPRVSLLSREQYAPYRPLLTKLLPAAMLAPAVIAVVRILPLPEAAKAVLWVLAIVAALIPLANAVVIISNRFVLPYTTGSVCNKSSVAAMLGVMDAVSPFQGTNEFPADQPFDEYFAEQQRIAEEYAAEAEAAAAAAYPHELAENEATAEADTEAPADGVAADAGANAAAVALPDVVDIPVAGVPVAPVAPVVPVAEPVADDPGSTVEMALDGLGSLVDDGAADEVAADDVAATPAPAVGLDDGQVAETDTFADEAPAIEEASIAEGIDADDPIETASLPVEDGAFDVESPDAFAEASSTEQLVEDGGDTEGASLVNAAGNIRFGEQAIRALGMVPASCVIVYEQDEPMERPMPAEPVDDRLAAVAPAPEASAAAMPAAATPIPEESPVEEDAVFEEPQADAEPAYAEDELSADEGEWDDTFVDYGDSDEESDDPFAGIPSYEPIEVTDEYIEILEDEPEDESAAPADDTDTVVAFEADGAPSTDAANDTPAPEDEAPEAESSSGNEPASPAEPAEQDTPLPVDQTIEQEPLTGDTQLFTLDPSTADDPSHTIAMPAPPAETVDSLMAEISSAVPAPSVPPRVINLPSTADAPVPHTPQAANRASLFDLPDPSAHPVDPFASPAAVPSSATVPSPMSAGDPAEPESAFTTISPAAAPVASGPAEGAFDTILAPEPVQEKPKRGIGRLFGRKKKNDDSMSEWLGVEDDFDAKSMGGEIGTWDNFNDDGWKGGAAASVDMTEAELRDAIASMGDDELLGHDIWFVATGASENGNAGIKAFLNEHRDKLRGVFLINLECVGAGQPVMLATEGEQRVLKGDKRIMKLVSKVSADFHHEFAAVEMPYVTTDAHAAMSMSLRSLTIAGADGTGFALSHSEDDQPYNVDPDTIALVADVVTEVIRRS